jgi:hypothetical protein
LQIATVSLKLLNVPFVRTDLPFGSGTFPCWKYSRIARPAHIEIVAAEQCPSPSISSTALPLNFADMVIALCNGVTGSMEVLISNKGWGIEV